MNEVYRHFIHTIVNGTWIFKIEDLPLSNLELYNNFFVSISMIALFKFNVHLGKGQEALH